MREYTEKYFGVSNSAELVAAMIRGGMGSVARLFVAQLQDHLGLAEGSRVNIPGQPYGNWQWRLDKNTDLFAHSPRALRAGKALCKNIKRKGKTT